MPFISVIITAHNRKEFLLEAVNSALNQTLPKDEYEIIVVKNFQDEKIDKFLEENNVKNIVIKDEPLGAKILKGVEESKGEVISLLEDDDLWMLQKLEIVKEIFKDKDIVYYGNNYLDVIYKNNKKMYYYNGNEYIELTGSIDALTIQIADLHKDKQLFKKLKASEIIENKKAIGLRSIQNNSSISIRKDILKESYWNVINEFYIAVDLALFYLAICSKGEFVFDNRILTLKRNHLSNLSLSWASQDISYKEWPSRLSKISKLTFTELGELMSTIETAQCDISDTYKEKLISEIKIKYLEEKVIYSRLPNTKNELTRRELVEYLKNKTKFREIIYGFLAFSSEIF